MDLDDLDLDEAGLVFTHRPLSRHRARLARRRTTGRAPHVRERRPRVRDDTTRQADRLVAVPPRGVAHSLRVPTEDVLAANKLSGALAIGASLPRSGLGAVVGCRLAREAGREPAERRSVTLEEAEGVLSEG
jgi:hypothetical protein